MKIDNFGYDSMEEWYGFDRDSSSGFYTDDGRSFDASKRKTVRDIIPITRTMITSSFNDDYSKASTCKEILERVMRREDGNFEIDLCKMIHLSKHGKVQLGTTVVKMIALGTDEPIYHYLKPGEGLEAVVFIGGLDDDGYCVTIGEGGKRIFTSLSEFHLLSIVKDVDYKKEIGLVTDYIWSTSKVYSGIVKGYPSLDMIKHLLLAQEIRRSIKKVHKDNPERLF